MIGISRNAEVQTGIRSSIQVERLIGVVQEVEGGEPELQAITLPEPGHVEIFVESQIRIKERRTVDVGPDQCSILALCRNREAGWIEVLT